MPYLGTEPRILNLPVGTCFLLAGELKAAFSLPQLETRTLRHSSFLSGEKNERKYRFSSGHMGHFTCQKISRSKQN